MTHPRSLAAPLVAALATLAAFGCTSGEPSVARAVRTDSAGVTIVANDSTDRPLGWLLEERYAVGGAEDGPEALFGLWEAGIGVDSLGRLYILDTGNFRVVVFDSAGTFVRTQGAKGGGPGELQMPAFLVVRADGEVGVYDYSRSGLVRFAADGAPLPFERMGDGAGGPPPDGLRAIPGGFVLARRDYAESSVRSQLVVWRDSGETELSAVERPMPPMHMFKSCGGQLGMRLGQLFEPQMTWASLGGRVVAAAEPGYVVDVYDGERRVRSIRRAVPPVPATTEMARREIGEGMRVRFGSGECTIHPDEVIAVRGLAPALPAIRSIALAPDSSLWVERGRVKGDPAVIDVFSPEGDYVGTLPPGSPMPAAFMRNGDIVSIVTDDLDVQRVVAYRVRRTDVVRETARR